MVNVSIPYMDPMGLVMTNSLLLNMAMEIVDLAIKHIKTWWFSIVTLPEGTPDNILSKELYDHVDQPMDLYRYPIFQTNPHVPKKGKLMVKIGWFRMV